MKVYVVTYCSFFTGIYSETKLFTDPCKAAEQFTDYVDCIVADLYDGSVWDKVKSNDNGGKKLTINTDTWCFDVELNVF